ncbi:MAG: type II toxin-antitoxin system HicB family antitoxin [Candidatus Aenigmarchaeota archaeon]|nr:type II toxin-antitoxin system HicB family antitoxin [Candidatus Aenigmarchaeota archaeon]
MATECTIMIEEGADGFLLSEVLELPGCHTQAKSLDELMQRTREAIRTYREGTRGEQATTKFRGIQRMTV